MTEEKKPISKYVKRIIHYPTFMWFSLQPTVDTLIKINKIFTILDRETFGRNLFDPFDAPKTYADFAPDKHTLNDGDDDCFAIMIAQETAVELIVLKHAKSFEECRELCLKEFEI